MTAHNKGKKPKARDPAPSTPASLATGPPSPVTNPNPITPGAAKPPANTSKGATPMSTSPIQIVFLDIKQNFRQSRERLLGDISDLYLQLSQNGALPPNLLQQLADETASLTAAGIAVSPPPIPIVLPSPSSPLPMSAVLDPFFTMVAQTLANITGALSPLTHNEGRFPSQPPPSAKAMAAGAGSGGSGSASTTIIPPATAPNPLTAAEIQFAAVYGLMENDSLTDPTLERFIAGVSTALGEYTKSQKLFDNVLPVIIVQGQTTDETGAPIIGIRGDQWGAVVRTLRGEGVQANDPLLALKATTILSGVVGGGDNAPPSSIDIDLPDLEAQSDIEIQGDNLRAMQAIYFAAQLEDLKVFQVVDKLVELFQNGMLPLGKGLAGNTLYDYWKQSIKRMTETERRNLFSRTFGFPGGDATAGPPNREFNDLWLRFVSTVSSFARQVTVDNLLRTNIPIPVSQQQVKKSARDLGANLSLNGYGIGYFAATELQSQIKEIITLLSDQEIRTAYGARDMWQVIDQVASLELGGAKNSIRYRTMATSGAVIIRWLAQRASLLVSTDQIIVLDVNQLRNLNSLRPRGVKSTVAPTDRDLVDACDQWLAVTGTDDKNVEGYAQAHEAPNQTSRPVYIPQVARDLLESVGIQAPGGTNGSTIMRKA
jgi:hypothetical protein